MKKFITIFLWFAICVLMGLTILDAGKLIVSKINKDNQQAESIIDSL